MCYSPFSLSAVTVWYVGMEVILVIYSLLPTETVVQRIVWDLMYIVTFWETTVAAATI
jgi:hypothetical protein